MEADQSMPETKCFNATTPDWAPLERAVKLAGLPRKTSGEFMWMGEWAQGEHSYKHIVTRKYARLRIDTPLTEAAAAVFSATDLIPTKEADHA
jgi:hypothetical protein